MMGWLRFFLLCLFVVTGSVTADAGAYIPKRGLLKVCRGDPYVDKRLNTMAINAPRGILFDDWGAIGEPAPVPQNHMRDIHVLTTTPFRIGPQDKCAMVHAIITQASSERSLKRSDKRALEIEGMYDARMHELDPLPPVWDFLVRLEVTVAEDFR